MNQRLRFAVPLAMFVGLVALLAAGLKLDPREVPSPLIGQPAPPFALTRLDDPGRTIRRDDLLGQVWLLNVWASWCAACRDEHPHLLAFARSRRVAMLGLNYKDSRERGLTWLARFGNPYDASLFDADGRVGIEFGVYGVPETFVIDRHGVVRFKLVGAVTPQVIEQRIVPLLEQLDG